MIYLKTILYITLFLLIINSSFFITYHNINYYNLVFIIMPILAIFIFYNIFRGLGVRKYNPKLYSLHLNSNIALIISLICNVLVLGKFDVNKFLIGNVEDIRSDFNQFDVSILDQMLPILLVYPSAYVMFVFGSKKSEKDWKFFLIVFCVILFGLSSGGRAFVFIFLLLYLFIAKPKISTFKNYIFGAIAIFLFSFITIGRINKDLEFDSATYIEASASLEFNKRFNDENLNSNFRNLVVQTVFYFGHSVPAFCNKVENLEIEVLPRSIFGLQPFIERQLIRVGILNHNQNKRYLEMLSLAKGSGFFEESWSTAFLDVYFQEGIIFSILFFLLISFIFYQTNLNLIKTDSLKHRVLTGFHIVFIISFFLTPVFMDTTWFFTYVVFFFCNDKDLHNTKIKL